MARIAIVVGHNERAQGAVRVTDGVTEYVWNGRLAEMIRAHDPENIRIFRRKHGGGYAAEIDRVYAEVDRWGAKVSVELHFNGGPPSASGSETLTSGTQGSLKLAEALQARIAPIMPGKNRGVKTRGRKDRGGRSLWQGKAPAALIEPYFGSHATSCLQAEEAMDELAEAVFRGARDAMGLSAKIKPTAPKPTPKPAPKAPTTPPAKAGGGFWAFLRSVLGIVKG